MRSAAALLTVAAVVGTACAPDGTSTPAPASTTASTLADEDASIVVRGDATGTSPRGGVGPFVRTALTPFEDCASLLDHVHAEARERVTPWGLDGHQDGWLVDDVMVEMSEDMAADMADMADDGAGEPAMPLPTSTNDAGRPAVDGEGGNGGDGVSTTNVQEAGVDEADIVKTDGRRIVTISDNVLTVVDVAAPEPTVAGRLQLDGWGHELFLAGDRAIVLASGLTGAAEITATASSTDAESRFVDAPVDDVPDGRMWSDTAGVYEIDLSDGPAIVSVLSIDGRYLSARAIGDDVYVAVASSAPGLGWLHPSGPESEERAREANRALIDSTTIDDWMPTYRLRTADGEVGGPLLDCAAVNRPATFAGFDVVSVLDLALDRGLAESLDRPSAVGVLASGETVYSSTDRFYVATNTWVEPGLSEADLRRWSEQYRTDLHAFAIAPDAPTTYVASGSVDGSLLDRFSISEHGGFVRVVTTEGAPWDRSDLSETGLTVLAEDDDELAEVGHVGGLGRGERLYAARLLGDVGFAVTFREIDPFYVLDLADPRAPRVSGELKIPGFSTYLHPVGGDRVLGIGQAATESGVTTGLKLSLFDVADPSDPREISVWTLPDATSAAEHDARAFQMWGDRAIVPVQSWSNGFNGAIVFEIGDQISELGRIDHGEPAADVSDCRILTVDDFPDGDSELRWMAEDGWSTLQLCGEGDAGGFETSRCDRLPIDEARWWFEDPAAADATFERLGATSTDRIEICFPDGGWRPPVLRSLVIGDDVWTMSSEVLQADDLDTFELRHRLRLR